VDEMNNYLVVLKKPGSKSVTFEIEASSKRSAIERAIENLGETLVNSFRQTSDENLFEVISDVSDYDCLCVVVVPRWMK